LAPDLSQDANTSIEQESIYHTAATIRLNKKLQNNSPDRQNVIHLICSLESRVKPRMVKVSSQTIPSSGHTILFLSVFSPIGITTVLSRLQERPEML
jgi:hypothetical protein